MEIRDMTLTDPLLLYGVRCETCNRVFTAEEISGGETRHWPVLVSAGFVKRTLHHQQRSVTGKLCERLVFQVAVANGQSE